MVLALPLGVILSLGLATAQVPIPNRPLGFIYGEADRASVVLDCFFDLLCPDSKAAWPAVKQVAKHYGPGNLQVRLQPFPLPYHRNAYYASQGIHVIAASNASAVYTWLEAVFAAQEDFSNQRTAELTATQVIQMFGELAHKSVGMPATDFVAGINNPSTDYDTRTGWKYACSRTVSGTPTFLLNGVQVAANPSWSQSEWQQLLDPLFQTSRITCPPEKPKCEYLPGKFECCLSGEGCIPNVGCRCAEIGCASKRSWNKASNITCPPEKPKCEYLPGKFECCLPGEGCIPNVGCRCAEVGCATKAELVV
jgi:protein-disulfide isomerase